LDPQTLRAPRANTQVRIVATAVSIVTKVTMVRTRATSKDLNSYCPEF
jgi:hypothetical protein